MHLPAWAYWVWWLLILIALVAAGWLGSRRERLVLATVAISALAFPILFVAWIYRFTGFGLQGRYVLPILMLLPLVSGEIIRPKGEALRGPTRLRWIPVSVLALIALYQGYAWWFNARASAEAPGTIRFYAHALWTPPVGWVAPVLVASGAMIAMIAAAVMLSQRSQIRA